VGRTENIRAELCRWQRRQARPAMAGLAGVAARVSHSAVCERKTASWWRVLAEEFIAELGRSSAVADATGRAVRRRVHRRRAGAGRTRGAGEIKSKRGRW
jgi:hypothetical protein